MKDITDEMESFWKIIGISFYNYKPAGKFSRFLYKIRFFVQFLNICVYIFLNFPIFDQEMDFGNIVFKCSYGVLGAMLNISYLVLYINRSKMGKLLKILIDRQNKSPMWNEFELQKRLMRVKKFSKFLQGYCLLGLFFAVVKFLIDLSMDGKTLPFSFPFDATKIEILPLIFVWILTPQISVGIFFIASNTLLSTIVVVVCIEFDILRKHLQKWKKTEKFNDLIVRHNELLQIVEKMEEILSPIFFFNFILSSIVICFNAFHLSISFSQSFSISFVNVFILMGATMIIGLQCFFGQLIKDASENVSNEIYAMAWEDIKDIKVKKQLLIMLMRAQKPATLTIWKFADVSLERFTSVRRIILF